MRLMSRVKFNKKLFLDVLLTDLAIDVLPNVLPLDKLKLPVNSNIIGGAVAVAAGIFLKKPNITNAALALTASSIVGNALESTILELTGAKGIHDFVALPTSGNNNLLADYTNRTGAMPQKSYQNFYYN